MMNFYGRERELRTLHGAPDSGEFWVCLVYGRRRVGFTAEPAKGRIFIEIDEMF